MRTAMRSDCGQRFTGPRAVRFQSWDRISEPISPPPAKTDLMRSEEPAAEDMEGWAAIVGNCSGPAGRTGVAFQEQSVWDAMSLKTVGSQKELPQLPLSCLRSGRWRRIGMIEDDGGPGRFRARHTVGVAIDAAHPVDVVP